MFTGIKSNASVSNAETCKKAQEFIKK